MEVFKRRKTYVRKQQAGAGRCSSPVPSAPPTSSTRHSLPSLGKAIHAQRKGAKHTSKALTNIMENSCLNEMESTSIMQYRNEKSGVAEYALSKTNQENIISRSSVTYRTESVCYLENETNMKTGETSSGISIPTGVSSYLLGCLDSVSMSESTIVSSSLTSLSSPESFRGADESSGRCYLKSTIYTKTENSVHYKNSTLLDTSNAINIDFLPQLSNLSAITGPSSKKEPGDQSEREHRLIDTHLQSRSISTTIAGKTVCKIMDAREKTPMCLQRATPTMPTRPDKKLNESHSTKSKHNKCKTKVQFPCLMDTEALACIQPVGGEFSNVSNMVSVDASSENVNIKPLNESHSTKSKHPRCKKKNLYSLLLDTEPPACIQPVGGEISSTSTMVSVDVPSENVNIQQQTLSQVNLEKNRVLLTSTPFLYQDLALDISPVYMTTYDEELVPNATGPFVCSSEIVPASPSLEPQPQNKGPQRGVSREATLGGVPSCATSGSRRCPERSGCRRRTGRASEARQREPSRRPSTPGRAECEGRQGRKLLHLNNAYQQKCEMCSIIRLISQEEPSQPRPAPYTGKKIQIPTGVPIDFLLSI